MGNYDVNIQRRLRIAASFAALLGAAIALLVLAGWVIESPFLTSFVPYGERARAKTAVGLLSAACALLILKRTPSGWQRKVGVALAFVPALLSAFTLSKYLPGENTYTESWIYQLLLGQADPEMFYISPMSAAGLILLSASLLLLDSTCRRGVAAAQLLSLLLMMLSLVALIGYAYGAEPFYAFGQRIAMGFPSAAGLFALAAATMLARPDRLPVSLFCASNMGGFLARRVLPAAFLFPIMFGVLRFWGQQAGLYGTELGLAIYTLTNVVFFCALVGWVSWKLGGIDTLRLSAEDARKAEEKRFRATFNNAAVGIAHVALDGRWLRFNDCLAKITGYTPENLLRLTFQEITHPEDLASDLAQAQKLLTGEIDHYLMDKRYIREDNSTVWVSLTGSLVRNDAGKPEYYIAVVQDISERKRAEQALSESEIRLQAIFNSMTEAVGIFDASGNLLDINPAGLEMHGFAGAAPKRLNLSELKQIFELSDLQGNVLPMERWPLVRVLSGETYHQYEVRVSRNDGGRSFIGSFGGAPVLDAQGRTLLAVVTIRDVTAQRQGEQALEEAKAQVERHARELEATVAERTGQLSETVHELEAFSYSLSHDMRAPLRAMRGYSEVLQDEYGQQLGSGNVYLNRISSAAGRLDQLIQDVLTYSRIVRERITLTPMDLERLLRQLIDESPALQPPKAQIDIQSPLLPVMGHEAYLSQILSNLLYNAVKFVPPDRQPKVRVWTEAVDSEVRLCVEDNGIGIPKEGQPRLFGMFQRLHADKQYDGTGIGLTIVRKAAERMGGRITFESREGEGTTFIVALPSPGPEQDGV
jgi:PAS domain S-box-containing protein